MRIGRFEFPDLPPRYRSRKLWVLIVAAIAATGMCWAGKLSGGEWVDFMVWALGLYLFANAGQNAAMSVASAMKEKEP